MPDNLHVRMTAEQYDAYTATAVDPWDDLLIGRLLDIGTGTAVVLVKLCEVGPFAEVELIGSDFFEDMVAQARRRVEAAGVSGRVRIDQEDVHALSYPDDFARYLISKSTIHHWAHPVEAFREIHRVLEPGGVALIHEIRRDAPPEVIARFNEMRLAAGAGPSHLEEKYTPAEVREMCEKAGIGQSVQIHAPDEGPGAIGFEVRIQK
jgi:ubiquinone/menaquinone biosynthesis C-methylase UbiE